MAKKLGVNTPLDGYPAETLGGLKIGVSPLEMAGAYSTLAAGGVRRDPTAIKKVIFPNGDEDRPGHGQAGAGDVRARGIRSHQDPPREHHRRHRYRCLHRLPRPGRQDRHHRQLHRRLVRRLPAEPRHRDLGRLPRVEQHQHRISGGETPASIWNSFYTNAAVPCEDFTVPSEPMDWSSFGGDYTVSAGTSSEYGSDADTSGPTDADEKTNKDAADAGTATDPGTGTDTGTGTETPAPAPTTPTAPSQPGHSAQRRHRWRSLTTRLIGAKP